jgi:hypothetical protein
LFILIIKRILSVGILRGFFEFYDKNAKRVYGGKQSTTISITKRTYGNVFFYFLKNCLDSHFQNTKQNYFH